jgi:hypothetical protein
MGSSKSPVACRHEILRMRIYPIPSTNNLVQCFPTFVRPRPGKLFVYKTRPNKFIRKYLSNFFKFIH